MWTPWVAPGFGNGLYQGAESNFQGGVDFLPSAHGCSHWNILSPLQRPEEG